MSETPQGEGWWQASDGRWYPPELHPQFLPPPPHLNPRIRETPRGTAPAAPERIGAAPADALDAGPVSEPAARRSAPLRVRTWQLAIAAILVPSAIVALAILAVSTAADFPSYESRVAAVAEANNAVVRDRLRLLRYADALPEAGDLGPQMLNGDPSDLQSAAGNLDEFAGYYFDGSGGDRQSCLAALDTVRAVEDSARRAVRARQNVVEWVEKNESRAARARERIDRTRKDLQRLRAAVAKSDLPPNAVEDIETNSTVVISVADAQDALSGLPGTLEVAGTTARNAAVAWEALGKYAGEVRARVQADAYRRGYGSCER